MKTPYKVAVILINRDRPEITDRVYEQVREMGQGLEKRIFVVECGSRPEGRSRYATHWFRDPPYRGRYYGFHRGLKIARGEGEWDFFWFLVNDISFDTGSDVLAELVGCMEEDARMALVGPCEPEAEDYKGCYPREGRRWHKASTVHGLAWLMRAEAIREVGYCNPRFRYSQGASTELAYRLYRAGWFLAYADKALLYHDQSGSTYGVVTKISRHEYHRRARAFASRYFVRKYGVDWDKRFSAVLPGDVEDDTFPWHRAVWEKQLPKEPSKFQRTLRSLRSRLKRIIRKAE